MTKAKTKAAANNSAATATEVAAATTTPEVAPTVTTVPAGAAAATKEKAPKAPKEPKVHVETKADKARAIFARMSAVEGTARKDVVKAFETEIGLSAAASATYYQNIKAASAKAAAKVAAAVTEAAPAAATEVAPDTINGAAVETADASQTA